MPHFLCGSLSLHACTANTLSTEPLPWSKQQYWTLRKEVHLFPRIKCKGVRVCACMHVCVRECVHVCAHMCLCLHMCVRACVYMCTHVRVYVHACVCVCVLDRKPISVSESERVSGPSTRKSCWSTGSACLRSSQNCVRDETTRERPLEG